LGPSLPKKLRLSEGDTHFELRDHIPGIAQAKPKDPLTVQSSNFPSVSREDLLVRREVSRVDGAL